MGDINKSGVTTVISAADARNRAQHHKALRELVIQAEVHRCYTNALKRITEVADAGGFSVSLKLFGPPIQFLSPTNKSAILAAGFEGVESKLSDAERKKVVERTQLQLIEIGFDVINATTSVDTNVIDVNWFSKES